MIPLAASLALLAAPVEPDRTDALVGDWGGPRASLFLGESDGEVHFGCREGSIFGPYLVRPGGTFRWTGTMERPRRGKPLNVTYIGRLNGNIAITISARLPDGTTVGPYRLERFRASSPLPCGR